jgi:hypothetical protein
MPQFTGTYTREAGLKRTYAYRGQYEMDGNLLSWSADVSCDGAEKGHPAGKISLMVPAQQDLREHAEFMMREAVEKLSDVEE